MRLVVDTDVFCKLGVSGLFGEALNSLGMRAMDCSRLAALPHMLCRGLLPKTYGVSACMALVSTAKSIPALGVSDATWLDRLTQIQDVDPGEAQIYATAAQQGLMVMSGDKRALRGIKDVPGYADALLGRVVVFEAILIQLCGRMGHDELRRRLQPLMGIDKMVSICFSEGNKDPLEALLSYYRNLAVEVKPLRLWVPEHGESS